MSLHGFHFEVKATRDEVNSKYFFFLQVSVASSLLFLRCGWSQRKTSQIILFGSNSVIFSVVNSVENEETAGSGSPTIVSAGSESSTISSSRDIRGKFCNIALHCNRNQMRWNHHERVRKRELKVRNAGNSLTPFPCTKKVRLLSKAFAFGSVVFSLDTLIHHPWF